MGWVHFGLSGFAVDVEDLFPFAVGCLRQQLFICSNLMFLAFYFNPSFHDFAARIAREY